MEKVTTGLPELDALLGPIESGTLILVEGREEAYPTLLLHVIAYNSAIQNWNISYLIVEDSPEDYEQAMSTIGYNLKPLISIGRWEYVEFENVQEAWNSALDKCGGERIVIVDSQEAPEATHDDLKRVKSSGGILILRVEPEASNAKNLVKLERLSHLLIRLYVEKRGRSIGRVLEVTKFKRRPRRDAYLTYLVSEAGISVEKLRRIV